MNFSKQKMFCTICGKEYLWNANFPFSKSRTCCKECHNEFEWRYALSICGRQYEPPKLDNSEIEVEN